MMKSRYFTRQPTRAQVWAFWVEDEVYSGPTNAPTPTVCDHEATYTGLLDATGGEIWRAPNPIGFRFDDEQAVGG